MNPFIRTISRFKEDYWIIMSMLLIFEQELLLIMLIVFGYRTFNHHYLVITVLILLFIEITILSYALYMIITILYADSIIRYNPFFGGSLLATKGIPTTVNYIK